MDYLDNIDFPTGSNMGSVVEIKVVRVDDVTAEPELKDDKLYGSFTFLEGKGFVTWKVATQRVNMDSESRETNEGISRRSELKFIIPKDQPIIRNILDEADNDEFIVCYKDANGFQRIFGSIDKPVSFIHKRSTGRGSSDLNGFECEFYFSGSKNDYFYDDTVANAPAGNAPAVVRVNGIVVASLSPGETIDFDTDFDFDFQIIGT